MDILYPHLWTTINRELTYAVLFLIINAVSEYDYYSIFYPKQLIGLNTSSVNTENFEQMLQP